jgi:TFIIF-interacting CTD phosphatase-like protein
MKGKVCVIDLDETLVHSSKERLALECELCILDYYVYLRPHARSLLHFVHNHFEKIVFFTASEQDYAAAILRLLYNGLHYRPYALYHRAHCKTVQWDLSPFHTSLLHNSTGECSRPSKILRNIIGEDWNDSVFIDDCAFYAIRNSDNIIIVPRYDADAVVKKNDNWLRHLISFLYAKPSGKTWSQLHKERALWWAL